ncbi:hypothetical protein ABW20_dc0108996 [Dactylellina cionopaga]|nr:hypothetical protein ABW20_dc0108996 [Dactylellina cionopaga]
MKVNFLTVAALSSFVPYAAGYTITRANLLSEDTFTNAPSIMFTGPAIPGGPNVTITGTVDYIFGKLHEMNPKYDPWEFPEYQERMARKGLSKNSALGARIRSGSLRKRGETRCNVSGAQVGNWYMQCAEGLKYLSELNGYCGAPKGHAGCARVSCSHSCGIFLCNDVSSP